MTKSPHSTQPNQASVQREAAASDVRHHGPTADRYHDAMVRYLDAVAGAGGQPHQPYPQEPPQAHKALIGEVMTRSVVAVHEGAVFKDIVAALARNRISAVPVIDDDRRVLGVVSESDLLAHVLIAPGSGPRPHDHEQRAAIRKKAHALTARDLMSTPAVTTRAHATIVEAARIAARARVRHLPVVNAKGVLVGIVSRGDLLRVFLRTDQEISDEIKHYASHTMHLDTSTLTIDVAEGVVTLAGNLARRLQVVQLVNHVRAVSGVVDVVDRLDARFDDRYFPAPRDAR